MDAVFDSRDCACKTPFGAVPCGASVCFTLSPRASEGFSHCSLMVHAEFSDCSLELPLAPTAEGRFTGSLAVPRSPELLWYFFRFTREDGSGCFLDRSGYRSEGAPDCWLQTVYDDSRPTPTWFGAGVSYQIFPDRFCRLSVPDAAGMPGKRRVHQRWEEPMDYLPDERGEILNCDFYGGSLAGIAAKLPYLQALGVETLYLCPIFESTSNHRYNTADYLKIDPMLGTEEDFRALCKGAKALGMHVILDGVFNHTGSESVYFNLGGSYPSLGAAQGPESPYYDWYHFTHFPDAYDAWWGIATLPAVNEYAPSYGDFLIENEDSVLRHWLRAGADGWRLDVADELPDAFIERMRRALEETKEDALLLGEVWENGVTKIAYSARRRYLLGRETHGLMNYPFRTALLAYLLGGDAAAFHEQMEDLRESYPPAAFACAMNFLGTHDTPRILTVLGAPETPATREARAAYTLSPEHLEKARKRLTLAALILFSFPGSPTVFYGDEAGLQGFEDPFNRASFPWGREDAGIEALYARLGALRRTRPSLRRGALSYCAFSGAALAYTRSCAEESTLLACNAGETACDLRLPCCSPLVTDALTGQQFAPQNGILSLTLPPLEGVLLL